ncbi:MAG TPA: hypothetical protein QF623_14505 [SAR324 cluster bacterium]|nr:hypothetical protein [SAR324 cluster bacterium]
MKTRHRSSLQNDPKRDSNMRKRPATEQNAEQCDLAMRHRHLTRHRSIPPKLERSWFPHRLPECRKTAATGGLGTTKASGKQTERCRFLLNTGMRCPHLWNDGSQP